MFVFKSNFYSPPSELANYFLANTSYVILI